MATTYPFDLSRMIDICRQNDVSMIGIFGSMARGEAKKKSDIDLIVRFSKRKSLLGMVRLERELTEALGRKVDLLTEPAISPYMRASSKGNAGGVWLAMSLFSCATFWMQLKQRIMKRHNELLSLCGSGDVRAAQA